MQFWTVFLKLSCEQFGRHFWCSFGGPLPMWSRVMRLPRVAARSLKSWSVRCKAHISYVSLAKALFFSLAKVVFIRPLSGSFDSTLLWFYNCFGWRETTHWAMEMAHTQAVSAKTDRSQPKVYCILPLSASDFNYTRAIHVQETSDMPDSQTGRNPDVFCKSFARHPATKWRRWKIKLFPNL